MTADGNGSDAVVVALAGLIDHADDAMVALDRNWFVTMWSKGAERMYGWTEEEVIGRHTTAVADLEMSGEARAASRRAVAEHGRWRGEVVAHRKDGSAVTVELVTVAPRDDTGGCHGLPRHPSRRDRTQTG